METDRVASDLIKELKSRGTADLGKSGIVNQVMQALNESEKSVEFLVFGEKVKRSVIPIEQACSQCVSPTKKHFPSSTECRERQKKDAVARGFHDIVCPQQFETH